MNESICDVCGKRFALKRSLAAHRKLSKSCNAERRSKEFSQRLERRAEESAALLVAEGEDPRVAVALARTAYGIQDRAPRRDPQLSRETRRAWLDEAATARHSERLPSVEGRTSGAVGARR